MDEKNISKERDFKLLNSLGGLGGIIAFLALLAGVCGFFILRSNLNYLGIGDVVDVSIDDYIQEGGRYLFTFILSSFFYFFLLYFLIKGIRKFSWYEKIHKGKIMLFIVSVLCFWLIVASIVNGDTNIIFKMSSSCTDVELYNRGWPNFLFFLNVFLLVLMLMILYSHFTESTPENKKTFQLFGLFWLVLFLLLPVSYGKNVYQKQFLVINDDIIFSDALKGKVPQNDLLFIHSNESDYIFFQCSEHKIYQVPKSAILQISFSGEKRGIAAKGFD